MNRLFLIFLLAMSLPVMAQDREYELQDPYPAPAEAWNAVKSVTFGWGTIDERYQRNAVPALSAKLQLSAWRGERVSAQAVLLAPRAIKSVSAKVSDLKSGKNIIPAAAVNKYFVCYSMADGIAEELRDLMQEAPDQQTRQDIQRIVSRLEQM